MTKKLNIDAIQNELSGGSAFFPSYANKPAPVPPLNQPIEIVQPKAPKEDIQGVPPTVPRPVPRTGPLVPKVKRSIVQRKPFDIYEDQYLTLRKIADAERGFVDGRGMSQMVRDALDAYFKAHGIPLEKISK